MNRYPLAALCEALGMSEAATARRVGLSGTTLKAARENGFTEAAADRYAARAGFVVWLVWPEWIDHVIASCEVECAERSCSGRFVPSRKGHRFCSKKCLTRAKMQDYRKRRQDDPDYAEARRREARERYAADGEYIRAQRRRYYHEVERERGAA